MLHRENCQNCNISLSEYEQEEFKSLCLDCYREENDLKKTEKVTFLRMKNKKYVLTTSN